MYKRIGKGPANMFKKQSPPPPPQSTHMTWRAVSSFLGLLPLHVESSRLVAKLEVALPELS